MSAWEQEQDWGGGGEQGERWLPIFLLLLKRARDRSTTERSAGCRGPHKVCGLAASPLCIKPGPWKSNGLPQGTQLVGRQAQTRSEIPSSLPSYLSTNYFFENVYSLNYLRKDLAQYRFLCRFVCGRSKLHQVSLVHNNYFHYQTQKYVIKYFPGNVADPPGHHFYKPRHTA